MGKERVETGAVGKLPWRLSSMAGVSCHPRPKLLAGFAKVSTPDGSMAWNTTFARSSARNVRSRAILTAPPHTRRLAQIRID